MSLQISHAELRQTSLKALEGLGLPYGLAYDVAANIVWLEDRGLPGVRLLAHEIARSDGSVSWRCPELSDNGTAVTLYMREATGLCLAPGAIDCLHERRLVTVPDCRVALLFVAEAARRSPGPPGPGIRIAAGAADAWCKNGEATLSGTFERASVPVILQHGGIMSDGRMTARNPALYRTGFPVQSEIWEIVTTAARRILVPASTRSRGGAGAEVDDSL